jgi:hypothetical protein
MAVATLDAGAGSPESSAPPAVTSDVRTDLKPDDYLSKITKLVPAEVVTLFITLDGIFRTTDHKPPAAVYWIVFVVIALATYPYMLRVTRLEPLKGGRLQAALAVLSFLLWGFAIGGPFTYPERPEWDLPVYSAVLLPLYTFLVPLLFTQNSK